MTGIHFIIIAVAVYFGIKFLNRLFNNEKSGAIPPFSYRSVVDRKLSFDDSAIAWCANLLSVDNMELEKILYGDVYYRYKKFRIKKRSGGRRGIAQPRKELMYIQKTIYNRILSQVNIHPAATGFRKGMSIINNVKLHLGKDDIIKTDIVNFFGFIRQDRVTKEIGRAHV